MKVVIEIPDAVANQLAGDSGGVSRAVLEAVAIEAYRSGTVTPAQVQQMLGLASRWETEALLLRAEAFHDYTMDDLDRDIAACVTLSGNDCCSRRFTCLLLDPDRRN